MIPPLDLINDADTAIQKILDFYAGKGRERPEYVTTTSVAVVTALSTAQIMLQHLRSKR